MIPRALHAVASKRATTVLAATTVRARNPSHLLQRHSAAAAAAAAATCRDNPSNHYRFISSTKALLSNLAKYYRIEVSNIARPDATKITVRGPDVDGILASMTVSLAQHGCSLKELHAGYMAETVSFEKHVGGDQIEDVFFVAQQTTGEPFEDDHLEELGQSLLRSLENPLTTLSGKELDPEKLNSDVQDCSEENQISVLKKGDK